MNKNSLLKILGLTVAAVGLSACTVTYTPTGGGVVTTGGNPVDPYYRPWYTVYGQSCGTGYPSPGCNFYADGTKIIAKEDPYYTSNILLPYYNYPYYDSYGTLQYLNDYAWLSQTGILYDQYGVALNEVDSETSSKDLIADASVAEEKIQKIAGKAFAQKYALAEEKGLVIAKSLQEWAILGRSRTRSVNDMADFSKRLYGLDATRTLGAFQKALVTQSQAPLEELNVDVAAHWGTSPEVSKKILKTWYKSEVDTYGIK